MDAGWFAPDPSSTVIDIAEGVSFAKDIRCAWARLCVIAIEIDTSKPRVPVPILCIHFRRSRDVRVFMHADIQTIPHCPYILVARSLPLWKPAHRRRTARTNSPQ